MLQEKQQQNRKHKQKHLKVKSNLEVIGSAKKENFKSFFEALNSLWCPQVVRGAVPQMRGSRTECPQNAHGVWNLVLGGADSVSKWSGGIEMRFVGLAVL